MEKTAWVSGMFARQCWNTCILDFIPQLPFSSVLITDYKISVLLWASYHFLASLSHALSSFMPLYPFLSFLVSKTRFSPDFTVLSIRLGRLEWERKWETRVRFQLSGKDTGGVSRTFLEPVGSGVSPPLHFASPSLPNPCLICHFPWVQHSSFLVTGHPGQLPTVSGLCFSLGRDFPLPVPFLISLKQLTEAIASPKSKLSCSVEVLETMRKVQAWSTKMGWQVV